MPKYTVFESTNMAATRYAERIFDVVADKDIENGTFGHLGEQIEEGSHIYKFEPGVVKGEPVIVANEPAWSPDTSRMTNQRRDKFVIEAGRPFRAFVVKKTDEFAITIDGVGEGKDDMKVGAFVTVGDDGKLKAAASKTDDAVMEAQVMRERMIGATLLTGVREYGYANKIYTCKVTTLA